MNELSIIVPVHNVEKYLDKCLESLSQVELQNMSFLLMENASSDKSLEICKQWAAKDQRFKVIHLDEPGVSNARNKALNLCSSTYESDYITFVDADDYIDPIVFQKNFELFKQSGTDIAFSPFTRIGNGSASLNSLGLKKNLYSSSDIISEIVQERLAPGINFFGAIWRVFFKKSVVDGLEFNTQMRYHEDVAYLIKALIKAKSAIILENPYYFYRIDNAGSASANSTVNSASQRQGLIDELVKISASTKVNLNYAIIQRKLAIHVLKFKEISLSKSSAFKKLKAMWDVQKNISKNEIKLWEPSAFGSTAALYIKLSKKGLNLLAFSFIALRYIVL